MNWIAYLENKIDRILCLSFSSRYMKNQLITLHY